MKNCDIIIPVWNELESTRECISKLKENTEYPYRLIVIDNSSENATREYLENLQRDFRDFLLIRNSANLGFIKAVNQGMVASSAPYICLLNNDAYVTKDWLTNLIETVESGPKNIGIANPASNVFGKDSADGLKGEWQELDACKGFCILIKREVIEKIGFYDEIYGMGYFEEKDFSRKAIESGYICVRAKSSFVLHKDRLSFDKLKDRDEIFRKNESIYNNRWGRSFNIALITANSVSLEEKKNIIYNLLKKGHRMHIFLKVSSKPPSLKDHISIKYMPIPRLFFTYITLVKLWKKRKKKPVELIISEDNDIINFMNRFKFVHGCRVSGWEAVENTRDTDG